MPEWNVRRPSDAQSFTAAAVLVCAASWAALIWSAVTWAHDALERNDR